MFPKRNMPVRVFEQFLQTPYRRLRGAMERQHDRRLGITTVEAQVARRTGCDESVPIPFYRAMFYSAIPRVMAHLDPQSSDALLDVGCGAGRVVCVAAQYNFARIIGIEIDPAVGELAQENVRALRKFRIRPEIVLGDATAYRIPDEITWVFLHNPFGMVLRETLTRILESYDRNPRRLRIAYGNPREHDLVLSMPRFVPTGRMHYSWRPKKDWQRTQAVQFYEVQPAMPHVAATKRMPAFS
jgi:SAM-dependent methyltransferase